MAESLRAARGVAARTVGLGLLAFPIWAVIASAAYAIDVGSVATLVSESLRGVPDAASGGPASNADGSVIAFYSDASNLVPNDTNHVRDVFVAVSGAPTERVSISSSGEQANGASQAAGGSPGISADGNIVAFYSSATNLVPGDTNGWTDVFVRDRAAGLTELVSVSGDEALANGPSFYPSLSADGNLVAFQSQASNLVPDDSNNTSDIFIRNRAAGTTERACGVQPNDFSFSPSISPDGACVAFASRASNLVAGDTNGAIDIFVCDLGSGALERVSVADDGTQGNGDSILPDVSNGCAVIVFKSLASNLVPGDRNGRVDVFARDRTTGTTERISVGLGGTDADDVSFPPSISDDGRFVAFGSWATNLVPFDLNRVSDVFVRDRLSGITALVDVAPNGAQANRGTVDAAPGISGDGSRITFVSLASNLAGADSDTLNAFVVHNPLLPIIAPTETPLTATVTETPVIPTETPTVTPTESEATPTETAEAELTETPAFTETPLPALTATATVTETITNAPTTAPTPSQTVTASTTETATAPTTETATVTATATQTDTVATVTFTPSLTASVSTTTPTATASQSATATETSSATPAETGLPGNLTPGTATATATETPATATATETPATATATQTSATATVTTTESASPSVSATASATTSPTLPSTATPTLTVAAATATASASPSATVSASPSATASVSPSATVSVSPTDTSIATATASVSPSSTETPSQTATMSASATASASQTATMSASTTATASQTASVSPTLTAAPTLTSTPLPTFTGSATPSASATASPTLPLPTLTLTIALPTLTLTPLPTLTPSPSSTVSATDTATPTITATASGTATATATVTATASATMTAPGGGAGAEACAGDCDYDGQVTVDNLITGLNISLDVMSLDACPSFDVDGDGAVSIDELLAGVNHLLSGCSAP